MIRNIRAKKGKCPPYPALPRHPYWNSAEQTGRFCAGEDEAREYADYLRSLGCAAVAILPSEFPQQVVPIVVLAPCVPWKERPTGPNYAEESGLYENFKLYEMQARATDQYRNILALLSAHEREKNGIKRENLLTQLGQVVLPGLKPGYQHSLGYLYQKYHQKKATREELDQEITKLILDGCVEKSSGLPYWKPHVLLWEGDDECASAPSIRFEGKVWTISHIDDLYKLYLGGHEIPSVQFISRSQAVALAEAYEKVMGDPPDGIAELLETLIGKRIRLIAFGGDSDACGRIAAITDDTIGVVLEGSQSNLGCVWFSRYNGRSLADIGASSGKKITDQILKTLDEQFPRDPQTRMSTSERPAPRLLARVASAQDAQDWYDSTPGIYDLDELMGLSETSLDELMGLPKKGAKK